MRCDVCAAELAASDLITIEERQVCASCKPTIVQQLLEGCLPTVPAGVHPVENNGELLPFGGLVAVSWKLFRQDWFAILALALLTSVPVNLLLEVLTPSPMADGESVGLEFVRVMKMSSLLETVIGVVSSLGTAFIVSERVAGRRASFGAAIGHALKRWLPGIGTGLLESIIVGCLLLLLVVPGIIWFFFYTFSTCAVALRQRSGTSALAYSKSLVQGRWWAVTTRVLVLTIPPMSAAFVIGLGVAFAPDEPIFSVLSGICTDLFFAYVIVGVVALFLNLEAIERKQAAAAAVLPGN